MISTDEREEGWKFGTDRRTNRGTVTNIGEDATREKGTKTNNKEWIRSNIGFRRRNSQ